jgi:hypothetical protein
MPTLDLNREVRRTAPDFEVYRPKGFDQGNHDTGNDHVLVCDAPDKSLMIVWTQSTAEGLPDQHIMFARSGDDGATWSAPRQIAGPGTAGSPHMASWAFPMVTDEFLADLAVPET